MWIRSYIYKEELMSFASSQPRPMRRAEREVIADVVIDSEQPFEQMFDAVDTLVAQWRSGCGEPSRRAMEQEV